jgi:hypothetical protein
MGLDSRAPQSRSIDIESGSRKRLSGSRLQK